MRLNISKRATEMGSQRIGQRTDSASFVYANPKARIFAAVKS
jgi:hypothetical protein